MHATGSGSRKLVSYVFPIFNESGNIQLLYRTITDLLATRTDFDYELIFVNDGSRDDSLEQLADLQSLDPRILVIDFARNFGHQLAVTAGLDAAHGDAVIIMDSDLQDPPAVSLQLIDEWQQGYDVVYAKRRTRRDTPFKRVTAHGYYWLLHTLADINIPRDTGDFRLLDRSVVDQLKRMGEHNRFLRGMVSWVGFRQKAVLFDRDERHAGVSGYPLRKMLKFASDGIMSFSAAPLKLISRMGYVFSGFAFAGILYALLMKVFAPRVTIEGWTFIVISILLIGGIQLIMLGILGSYIGRVYTEVQGRPLYIVRSVLGETSRSDQGRALQGK